MLAGNGCDVEVQERRESGGYSQSDGHFTHDLAGAGEDVSMDILTLAEDTDSTQDSEEGPSETADQHQALSNHQGDHVFSKSLSTNAGLAQAELREQTVGELADASINPDHILPRLLRRLNTAEQQVAEASVPGSISVTMPFR